MAAAPLQGLAYPSGTSFLPGSNGLGSRDSLALTAFKLPGQDAELPLKTRASISCDACLSRVVCSWQERSRCIGDPVQRSSASRRSTWRQDSDGMSRSLLGGCEDSNRSSSSCKAGSGAYWAWGDGGVTKGFSDSPYKFNLEEYMVTLDRPLGIRFCLAEHGAVIVESLMKHGNAESCRMIMVGDVLRKASLVAGDALLDVGEDVQELMRETSEGHGPMTLVFERAPHALHTKRIMAKVPSERANIGKVGFAAFHHPSNRPWNARVKDHRGGAGHMGCSSFMEKLASPDLAGKKDSLYATKERSENKNSLLKVLGFGGSQATKAATSEQAPKEQAAGGSSSSSGFRWPPLNVLDPEEGVIQATLRSLSQGLFGKSGPPSASAAVAAAAGPAATIPKSPRSGVIPQLPMRDIEFDTGMCCPPAWTDDPEDAGGGYEPSGAHLYGDDRVDDGSAAVVVPDRWPLLGFYEPTPEGSGKWWGLGVEKEAEFASAYQRFMGDLQFEPAPALAYTEVTSQLIFGSGLRSPLDICFLRQNMGMTAVLDLQQPSDPINWGLNPEAVIESAQSCGMPFIRHPIRRFDGHHLRENLPQAVAVLHRLLRMGHHVYLCSTEGLDRAPSVVVAYLHWVLAIPLKDAINFVQELKPCAINRAAITAATWDAIAFVGGEFDVDTMTLSSQPPTHTVQIVWNYGGREVLVIGECSGGWNKPIPATAVGGSRFVLELRLPMGLYRFKFLVDGGWRHAADMPTEVDPFGNTNNLLRVGKIKHASAAHKGGTRERVIERPLTDAERRLLTFSSQCMAFRINPHTFSLKQKGVRLKA